jgi:hypothetical protein
MQTFAIKIFKLFVIFNNKLVEKFLFLPQFNNPLKINEI